MLFLALQLTDRFRKFSTAAACPSRPRSIVSLRLRWTSKLDAFASVQVFAIRYSIWSKLPNDDNFDSSFWWFTIYIAVELISLVASLTPANEPIRKIGGLFPLSYLRTRGTLTDYWFLSVLPTEDPLKSVISYTLKFHSSCTIE